MRKAILALGALLTMATLGACAAPGGGTAAKPLDALPDGTRWRLHSSTFAGLEGGSDTGIRVEFSAGRLTGDSGCNRFFADAAIRDGRLALGPVGATKRACLGPRADSEHALFEALGKLDNAYLADGQLRLVTVDGSELVFVDDPTVAE